MENLDVLLLVSTALSLIYSAVCFFGFKAVSDKDGGEDADGKSTATVTAVIRPDARLLQISQHHKDNPGGSSSAGSSSVGAGTRRRTGHLYVQRKW
ncbi:hypothetical protein BV898_04902 [Hypsibius exemplaris]|uniref:Uncharacterized protein n=1 Tax=Hypsibius exemplaris TaxID=2072580 RepID=A0A1W0X110_HYPEX|nr:hypothetical protein BV898_04902 [Hypsibius exemplaris]